MSIRNNSNRLVNPMAKQAMDKFKLEVAESLNISDEYKSGYWGNMTSRECGAVGGQMVKEMIEQVQNQMANENNIQTNQTQQENQNYNTNQQTNSFESQQ
ncbi:alpha/beta-type small acid-soluble spore protein [Fuchsiella alkaliacetigena]|uniref:alpha/beta-type small acid-soluble spore protein n=1 Tax=Fuchsiella alkaliacetigena TaxID=957042 RepID=UPI00200B4698|nr:alpha/beta-type small acid-soluble spore protein [Fuchsiella alkaliacetigena]MCK8825206.1 alpha/beta-type small acid-soluble spore protein [Fuchsiella alkaliacetigena]